MGAHRGASQGADIAVVLVHDAFQAKPRIPRPYGHVFMHGNRNVDPLIIRTGIIHRAHSAILTETVTRHTRVLANVSMKSRAAAVLALIAVAALYLSGLTRMGMYSTDEPRYADIGRAMARSGDWITPRLWGQPWFEKPALLYWMTAAGFKLGLGADLAPRLPVALLSVAFLGFFWWRLRQIFDAVTANYATAILATS